MAARWPEAVGGEGEPGEGARVARAAEVVTNGADGTLWLALRGTALAPLTDSLSNFDGSVRRMFVLPHGIATARRLGADEGILLRLEGSLTASPATTDQRGASTASVWASNAHHADLLCEFVLWFLRDNATRESLSTADAGAMLCVAVAAAPAGYLLSPSREGGATQPASLAAMQRDDIATVRGTRTVAGSTVTHVSLSLGVFINAKCWQAALSRVFPSVYCAVEPDGDAMSVFFMRSSAS